MHRLQSEGELRAKVSHQDDRWRRIKGIIDAAIQNDSQQHDAVPIIKRALRVMDRVDKTTRKLLP